MRELVARTLGGVFVIGHLLAIGTTNVRLRRYYKLTSLPSPSHPLQLCTSPSPCPSGDKECPSPSTRARARLSKNDRSTAATASCSPSDFAACAGREARHCM